MSAPPHTSLYEKTKGFFSFDAAVAAISLVLIAHAIISAYSISSFHSLSSSQSLSTSLSMLQIADYLVKEGAVERNESAAFFASSFASHHELSQHWKSQIELEKTAFRMNLSYLEVSIEGDSLSTGAKPPAPLFCASRLALYQGEIILLEACGS